MGYVNPPKGKAKYILFMEKVCQPSLLTSSNCHESLNWLLENWIQYISDSRLDSPKKNYL